ncbi:MAG: hypothetical protein QM308_01400, partial [Bacillota bacterium]|nr:hypothetical protein [Bacillota bacterium]
MSIIGSAEVINLLLGLGADEGMSFFKDRLNDRKVLNQIIEALNLAIKNDPVLSSEAKDELTCLFKDKQHIIAFLEAANEAASETFDPESKTGKNAGRVQFDLSWKQCTRNMEKKTQTEIFVRLLSAVIKASAQTLQLKDRLLLDKLNLTQLQLEQHQNEIQQAVIDHLKQQSRNDFNTSQAYRMGTYLPKMLNMLRTDNFKGREAEIKAIISFIQNQSEKCDQWWWWQADTWAGKTTLMVHLAEMLTAPVNTLESEVSIAAVFIIGRKDEHSDSDAFYTYLIPQLAEIADYSGVVIPPDLQGRIDLCTHLFELAANKTSLQNKRLVILIDGLDEDQGPYRGHKKQSIAEAIAASLPALLPRNVRVIVSSRSNPALPANVPSNHPLRNPKHKHILKQSEFAKEAKDAAIKEIKEIVKKRDDQGKLYGLDMLAYMAASRGWLTANDLAELTDVNVFLIEEILSDGATARSFKSIKSSDGEPAYFIGHDYLEKLLISKYLGNRIRLPREQGSKIEIEEDQARFQQKKFRALKKWRRKIVDWAEEYANNWISDTLDESVVPDYLCSEAFAHLLTKDPDLEEQAFNMLTDQSRMLLLQRIHGNDYQSMKQLQILIDGLAERITTIPSETLTRLAAALHFLSKLSQRTRNIPADLPALFALLGKIEFAKTLALSISDTRKRIDALNQVATTTLAQTGNIEEAVKIANSITEPFFRVQALVDIARALAQAGNNDKAVDIAMLANNAANSITEPYYKSEALVNIARALAQAGNNEEAVKISKLAINAANSITEPYDKSKVLVNIARALAQAGNNEEAVKIANSITDPYYKSKALVNIARTLVQTGNNDKAVDIANSITEPFFRVQALVD